MKKRNPNEYQEIIKSHLKKAERDVQMALRSLSSSGMPSYDRRRVERKFYPLIDSITSASRIKFPDLSEPKPEPPKKKKEVKDG